MLPAGPLGRRLEPSPRSGTKPHAKTGVAWKLWLLVLRASARSGEGLHSLEGRSSGFFTCVMFFSGPGGSGDGLLLSLTLARPPPENSVTLSSLCRRDSRMRERLLDATFMFISLASRRGLGLLGSFLDGKLLLAGMDEEKLGDRLLGGLNLLWNGLRCRLRPYRRGGLGLRRLIIPLPRLPSASASTPFG